MSSTTTASAGKTPVAKHPSGTAPVDKAPPRLRGGLPFFGHMLPFAKNPYHFMQRAHDEGGEVVEFTMLGAKIVLALHKAAGRRLREIVRVRPTARLDNRGTRVFPCRHRYR